MDEPRRPSRSFPSTSLPPVGCPVVDPRPVGTEEFVFAQILNTPPEPCSGRHCGGKPSRRNCLRLFLLTGQHSTAAHLRSELALGIKLAASRRRVLYGLSLDNAEITPHCRILRHPRLQWSIRPLASPRVLIRDSSPRTPMPPNYRCCRLLESEDG